MEKPVQISISELIIVLVVCWGSYSINYLRKIWEDVGQIERIGK